MLAVGNFRHSNYALGLEFLFACSFYSFVGFGWFCLLFVLVFVFLFFFISSATVGFILQRPLDF